MPESVSAETGLGAAGAGGGGETCADARGSASGDRPLPGALPHPVALWRTAARALLSTPSGWGLASWMAPDAQLLGQLPLSQRPGTAQRWEICQNPPPTSPSPVSTEK